MGRHASAIAVLLSLTFFGSLLGLALVGGRRDAEQHPTGAAASPLEPGVHASPVQVDVPDSGRSPRPTAQGEPVGPSPVSPPDAGSGGAEHGAKGSGEVPQATEPPAPPPAAEPPPEGPPGDLESEEGTTHLKTGGEDGDETAIKDTGHGGAKDEGSKDNGHGKGKEKDKGMGQAEAKDKDKGGPKGNPQGGSSDQGDGGGQGTAANGNDHGGGPGSEGDSST